MAGNPESHQTTTKTYTGIRRGRRRQQTRQRQWKPGSSERTPTAFREKRRVNGHNFMWLKLWRAQVGAARPLLRKIAAHQITASNLNTFTNMFFINMRMKFAMTTTTKSGDELTSLKETFGLCEGRAEQHYYIPVRAT